MSNLSGKEQLICFGSDWHGHPSCVHHLVKHFGAERTLWINSLGMRTPQLSSHDLGRLWHRAKRLLNNVTPKAQSEGFWTLDPLFLPLQKSPAIQWLNRQLLGRQMDWACRKLNIHNPIVFTALPNSVDIIEQMNPERCVYYCLDDYERMPGVDNDVILAQEKRLVAYADLVLVTADKLYEKWQPHAKAIKLLPHGVDLDAFACPGPVPQMLKKLSFPRIGFFGTLDSWIDLELIREVARLRPSWQFPIIGPTRVDVERLSSIPNIHLLGPVPFSQIPACAAAFDVGLLPFVVNDFTMAVNPLKLREYFAAGLPAVSTSLAEVKSYQPLAQIADSPEEFVLAIQHQLSTPPSRQELLEAVRDDGWDARARSFREYFNSF